MRINIIKQRKSEWWNIRGTLQRCRVEGGPKAAKPIIGHMGGGCCVLLTIGLLLGSRGLSDSERANLMRRVET